MNSITYYLDHTPDDRAENRVPPRLRAVLEGINYKPGWGFVINVLTGFGVSLSGYSDGKYDVISIHAHVWAEDVYTHGRIELTGPGVRFHPQEITAFDEKTIVRRCFDAIVAMERHEMEEFFQYNGVRVYDPHKSQGEQEKLFELAGRF